MRLAVEGRRGRRALGGSCFVEAAIADPQDDAEFWLGCGVSAIFGAGGAPAVVYHGNGGRAASKMMQRKGKGAEKRLARSGCSVE